MGRLSDYVRKLAAISGNELLILPGKPPLYRAQHGLIALPGESAVGAAELKDELSQLLGPEDWQRLRTQHQTSFSCELGDKRRVRGTCHVSSHGYTLRLSVLDHEPDWFAELELPHILAPLRDAAGGLIIVTGPSDSGKSTLIAKLISQIGEARTLHIATSEDPVEYRLHSERSLIVQRAVGRHSGSHAHAVDTALATQAQLIACSDVSAPEVFETLLEAACSGVLVLGELPGLGAVHALERLLMCGKREVRPRLLADLADCLLAVIALDLVPGRGSDRALAVELLLSSRNVCSALRDGALGLLPGMLEREPGMQSMDRSLHELATRGLIDGREALRRATDKRMFAAWG